MAQGDVNRIAESFDWAGMPHAQAMQVMLEQGGAQTVSDFDVRRTSGCYFLRYA